MKPRRESGFALLLVFLMAAAIAITLYMQIPRVAFQSQRQKEQLLIERGEQYQRAIQLFVRANGRYPGKIEDLENFNNRRFLRGRYKDPITGKDEWRLVHVNAAGVLYDSVANKKKADEKTASSTEGQYVGVMPGLGETLPGQQNTNNPALRRRPSEGGAPAAVIGPDGQPIQVETTGIAPMPGQPLPPGAQPVPAGQPLPPGQPMTGIPGFPGAQPGGAPNPTGAMPVYPVGQNNPAQPGFNPANPNQLGPAPVGANNFGAPVLPGVPNPPGGIPPGQGFPNRQQNPVQLGVGQPGLGQAPNFGQQPGFGQTPAQPAGGQSSVGSQPYVGGGGSSVGSQPYVGGSSSVGAQPYMPGGVNPNPMPGNVGQMPQGFQPGGMQPGGLPPNFPQPFPQPGGGQPNFPQGSFQANPQVPQGAAPNQATQMIQNILTSPRQGGLGGAQPGGTQIGGGIAGVASLSEDPAIMTYNDHSNYNEWEFIYDFSKQRPLANLSGGGVVGTPVSQIGTPAGPAPGGGIGTGGIGTLGGGIGGGAIGGGPGAGAGPGLAMAPGAPAAGGNTPGTPAGGQNPAGAAGQPQLPTNLRMGRP